MSNPEPDVNIIQPPPLPHEIAISILDPGSELDKREKEGGNDITVSDSEENVLNVNEWECPRCTYRQCKGNICCEMCGEKQLSNEEWQCSVYITFLSLSLSLSLSGFFS